MKSEYLFESYWRSNIEIGEVKSQKTVTIGTRLTCNIVNNIARSITLKVLAEMKLAKFVPFSINIPQELVLMLPTLLRTFRFILYEFRGMRNSKEK